jgi:hypothetical protein
MSTSVQFQCQQEQIVDMPAKEIGGRHSFVNVLAFSMEQFAVAYFENSLPLSDPFFDTELRLPAFHGKSPETFIHFLYHNRHLIDKYPMRKITNMYGPFSDSIVSFDCCGSFREQERAADQGQDQDFWTQNCLTQNCLTQNCLTQDYSQMFGCEPVYISMVIAHPEEPPQEPTQEPTQEPPQAVLMQNGVPTTIPVYPRLSAILPPSANEVVFDAQNVPKVTRFDLDDVVRMSYAEFCIVFDMDLLPLPTYVHSNSPIRRTCAVSGSYNSESESSFKEFLYANLGLLRYETIATIRSIIVYQEDVCVREMQKYETARYNELLSVVIMLTDMYPMLLCNDISEIYYIMTHQMSFAEFVAKIQSRHEDVKTCVKDVVDRKQAGLAVISEMLSALNPGLSPRKMYILYDTLLKIEEKLRETC